MLLSLSILFALVLLQKLHNILGGINLCRLKILRQNSGLYKAPPEERLPGVPFHACNLEKAARFLPNPAAAAS
jgi:hypothetical protein